MQYTGVWECVERDLLFFYKVTPGFPMSNATHWGVELYGTRLKDLLQASNGSISIEDPHCFTPCPHLSPHAAPEPKATPVEGLEVDSKVWGMGDVQFVILW